MSLKIFWNFGWQPTTKQTRLKFLRRKWRRLFVCSWPFTGKLEPLCWHNTQEIFSRIYHINIDPCWKFGQLSASALPEGRAAPMGNKQSWCSCLLQLTKPVPCLGWSSFLCASSQGYAMSVPPGSYFSNSLWKSGHRLWSVRFKK